MTSFYATHAVDDLRYLCSRVNQNSAIAQYMSSLARRIENAIKFRLPDYGKIIELNMAPLSELIVKYANPLRLPFESIAVEYAHPVCAASEYGVQEFDAVIVLAQEERVLEKLGVTLELAYRTHFNGIRSFVPGNFKMCFFQNGEATIAPVTNVGLKIIRDVGDVKAFDIASRDFQSEMTAIISLIAALACKNVSTRIEHPPLPLARARMKKKNKAPFFSYHILEIEQPQNERAMDDNRGTHASPRIHLRRGHIRRLPNATIWVNRCVVGNKKLGVVAKDYAVEPARVDAT